MNRNFFNPYNRGNSANPIRGDKIKENYPIIAWRENNFIYNEINSNDLDSIFVNENHLFQEMKQLILDYNSEILLAKSKNTQIRNGPWRSCFFVRLHNILLEIIFTSNRKLQSFFIETVHSWTMDQIARLDYEGLPESRKKISENSENLSNLQTRPGSAIEIPENKILKRPFSAAYNSKNSYNAKRPVSSQGGFGVRPLSSQTTNMNTTERPGSSQGFSGQYSLIRPLSGWTRPLSSITRPKSGLDINREIEEESLVNEVEEELIENENFTEDKKEKNEYIDEKKLLPSEYIRSVLKDYQNGARTKILYEDPPYDRIKYYKRKILIPDKKLHEFLDGPQIEPVIEKEKILYQKPTSFLEQQERLREQKEEARKLLEEKKAQMEANKQNEVEEPEEEKKSPNRTSSPKKKKRRLKRAKKEYPFKASMIPNHKPYVNDELRVGARSLLNKEHLQNKFEIRSSFLQYQPTDDKREMNMELRWFFNRNKDVIDKRLDEELVTLLKEWSSTKERIDAELVRKNQAEYEASQFQKLEYKPTLKQDESFLLNNSSDSESDDISNKENIPIKKRPFTAQAKLLNFADKTNEITKPAFVLANIQNLEDIKAKKKIDNVRKLAGGCIGATINQEPESKMPKSLSIFNRQKDKPRPFSAFIQSKPISIYRNEQLFEIEAIKKKMAKHKLVAPTKTLMNALLIPEGITDKEKIFKLPEPGQDLLRNPFAIEKKKRRGRRKGKGKKKKK